MNRLLKRGILWVMIFPLFLLGSCGGDDEMNPEPSVDAEITFTEESQSYVSGGMTFEAAADSKTVHFTTNQAWDVEVASGEWCTVSPASGSAGSGSFTVSVTENTEDADRSTSITLTAGTASQTLQVMQKGKEFFVNVEQTNYKVSFEGGVITLNITANVDYEIEIPVEYQWIKCIDEDKERGTCSLEISANESVQPREALLIVTNTYSSSSVTISVLQEGAPEELFFSEESALLFAEGWTCSAAKSQRTITFITNCDWEVSVENETWCTVSPLKGQNGEASFIITISENTEEVDRSTIVTLKAGSLSYSLNIIQEKKNMQPPLSGENEDLNEEQGMWDE